MLISKVTPAGGVYGAAVVVACGVAMIYSPAGSKNLSLRVVVIPFAVDALAFPVVPAGAAADPSLTFSRRFEIILEIGIVSGASNSLRVDGFAHLYNSFLALSRAKIGVNRLKHKSPGGIAADPAPHYFGVVIDNTESRRTIPSLRSLARLHVRPILRLVEYLEVVLGNGVSDIA